MYRCRTPGLNSKDALLQLPTELKRLIYTFCFLPPHSIKPDYDPLTETKSAELHSDPSSSSSSSSSSGLWSAELYTGCQYPRSHLSLYSTCRQLRSELCSVFTEQHVINLSQVLVSTEQASATRQIPQLYELRHIALRWPPDGDICACTTCGKTAQSRHGQKHLCIGLRTDVEKDIMNLIALLESCQMRLQSIEFLLPLPCNSTSNAFAQYRALFRGLVYLSEVLIPASKTTGACLQRPLIQVYWPQDARVPLRARVDNISKATWDQIPDGTLVFERDCAKCSTLQNPVECHTHDGRWHDVDDILSAIRGHRTRPLTYPGIHDPKAWKVIFRPGGGFKYFTFAMIELERRRQTLT